jgi:hypothetical protein
MRIDGRLGPDRAGPTATAQHANPDDVGRTVALGELLAAAGVAAVLVVGRGGPSARGSISANSSPAASCA